MYEELELNRREPRHPRLLNTLTELPRALFEVGHLLASSPSFVLAPRGDGHPVLLMPGFMASDNSLIGLKNYLTLLGYRAETWGLGRNMGKPELLFEQLPLKLQDLGEKYDQPVSLIGQSLGGVFARELARTFPDLTRQVITLGSPFGATDSGIAIRLLQRLFENTSGKTVDEMRLLMEQQNVKMPLEVPMTAIYSKDDGVVNWQICRETEEDHQTQNIEVNGSHCGMGFNAVIYHILADRLAQAADGWSKFKGCSLMS